MRAWLSCACLVSLLAGCDAVGPPLQVEAVFDFRLGRQGWQADFADYSVLNEDLQLMADIEALPDELDVRGTGFYIQGMNRSDDLFMYLKHELGPLDGVRPGQTYQVRYRIVVASNAPTGCAGVGGAPGESVYLKAGASTDEPDDVRDGDGVNLNVDKGNQAEGGADAFVVGDIANGEDCGEYENLDDVPYVSLDFRPEQEQTVTADEQGRLWLFVGTDSGFEGLTGLYYQRIEAVLSPESDSPNGNGNANGNANSNANGNANGNANMNSANGNAS